MKTITITLTMMLMAAGAWAQDFTVPTDGSFVDAILAANNRTDRNRRYVILIKEGTHLSEGENGTPMVRLTAPNVTIRGEGMDRSIVENRPTQEGIGITSTLHVEGADNTVIEDLTLWCNFSNDPRAFANRAVALNEKNCHGNQLRRVRLRSTQDTYYTNTGGDTRLTECEIIGTVDFICGGGSVLFDHCHIVMVPRGDTGNRDVICAPATREDETGYVFDHCTIDGGPEQEGRFHLARPWRDFPTCVWINTRMNRTPSAEGYCEMHGTLPRLFAEYGSRDSKGKPIDCTKRRTTYKNKDGAVTAIRHCPTLTRREARRLRRRVTSALCDH